MSTPPPVVSPAAQALARVLRTSRLNGWSIVLVAGAGALGALLLGDLSGALTGLLAALAGGLELRGRRRLRRRDATGVSLMVRAELFLLAIIAVYAVGRMASFDAGYLREQVLPELKQSLLVLGVSLKDTLAEFDLTEEQVVPLVHRVLLALYGTVLLVSLVYQGGLARWYSRRADLVAEALATPPGAAQNASTPPPAAG
jgi:hypothetical protein